MGAVSGLVSVMLAFGSQSLPYHDPGRLVAVWERAESDGRVLAISEPDLADFADATHSVFSAFGGFWVPSVWLLDHKGATEIRTCGIQASIFSDLGIRPVLGRAVRSEDEPLTSTVISPVWISYRLWQTRYGGSPSVIGTTIGIAQNAAGSSLERMRIAGVLPPRTSIPLLFMENTTDVWYLLPREGWRARSRQSAVLFGVGRLRPGITVAQAQAVLTAVAERLGQRYTFDRGKLPVVQSLEAIAQGPVRRTTAFGRPDGITPQFQVGGRDVQPKAYDHCGQHQLDEQ